MRTLAFLGSKEIGTFCLKYLIEHADALQIKIVGVLSNNRSLQANESENVISLAHKHKLKIWPSLDAFCDDEKVDFILSVQYHEILKPKHIHHAKTLAINLHMAPLPEYRGCNQFSFAILNNEKEFGTTLHQLEEGIDSGAILAEKRFPIPENCFVQELYNLCFEASKSLFEESIAAILFGRFTPIAQQHLIAERGTQIHYRNEIKTIKQIELAWPEEKINRHIRATWFPPFEPPYAVVNGQKIPLSPNWKKELE